ncbi:putative Pectin lyase fold/virulence factor [Seiridium unicorne]|uniref:Pectin lyase fold/virulence factor n=1 Tax=Seiridium unicorne TaxID=138068 RepID=A0ABR2ULQ2_9PEZI
MGCQEPKCTFTSLVSKHAALVAAAGIANGTDIYVSPTGTGSGSSTAPCGSIQSALNAAAAGDTIYLLAGTYSPTTNIQITKSGTATSPITLRSYGTDAVAIDVEALPGLVSGPYGVYARDASHNYYELLRTHDNYESGFQLQGESENNTGIYLDSHRNRYPHKDGESANGFACKEGSGEGNFWRTARLWDNVDDGLDLYMGSSTMEIPDLSHSPETRPEQRRHGLLDVQLVVDSDGQHRGSQECQPPGEPGQHCYVVGNSWDSPTAWSNSSFKSISPTMLEGARDADGSVHGTDFLIPAFW